MVDILMVKRKSSALSPSSLDCLAHIPTVNVSSGCAHGCLYCYTRGYSIYPGEEKVEVYENVLDKLKKELPRKKRRPRAVYFSPSSDVFQPVPEVLDVTYGVFEYLLKMGVGVAFLTKGTIPDRHMKLLKSHAENVRAQAGLITLEEDILKVFEPRAASAHQRLSQIRELTEAGLRTQVRLDPILPGLTDDEDTLRPLIEAIAETGVKFVAASILFLRPAVTASLKKNMENKQMLNTLLKSFSKAGRLEIHAEHSKVMALQKEDRKAVFDRIRNIANDHGIGLNICACKNPDLASGSCSIAGDWIKPPKEVEQLSLFENP
ncbi:MAG: radical SAM protein [Deltaproteobacteria bacterium]|nr:radical SAM protein [Deltaproteobacteria bacterium]